MASLRHGCAREGTWFTAVCTLGDLSLPQVMVLGAVVTPADQPGSAAVLVVRVAIFREMWKNIYMYAEYNVWAMKATLRLHVISASEWPNVA